MPPHRRSRPAPPPPLDQRLTLAAWFADQMGYSGNREMLEDLRECKEEWDGLLHPVLNRAAARGRIQISADALMEMDENIRVALESINRRRSPKVALKYFQYLAALSAENFLRRYSAGPKALRTEIQDFAEARRHYPFPQSVEEMRKLAFWVATGGGKTLLMHLNYRQFLRRGLFSPDNVILVTPNETLSAQHIEEMRLSGIPCFRHGERTGGLDAQGGCPVRVLEITKLTAARRGAATVATDAFAGRNLILVDEGHKGAGGEAWFQRRDELAQKGFVFEYSATFGQALTAAERRTEEYARAIAIDYSYRHFYNDGYGKEFDVVNLGDTDPAPEKRDALMLGNLLVFLQQRMCFAENREAFARHNLESPLLLMLGATVTGGQGRTDMAEFMGFLSRVSLDRDRDNREWLDETAGRILRGRSGISGPDNKDVFADRLRWLNRRFGGGENEAGDVREVRRALLKFVFRAEDKGALQFCSIPGAKGEAALRVGGGGYFGLMYVGDVVPKLREKFEDDEECEHIQFPLGVSAGPMFSGVAHPNSPVNILIGAKKFMEGWSSWRVSGMGMLNVGVNEGPLVIQLFGRGVRLKGAGMSLKRGGSPDAPPPPDLALLETMNIFGVRANFVGRFREYLEREGVVEEHVRLPLSGAAQAAVNGKLLVPGYPKEEEFEEAVLLDSDKNICAVLDLSSSALRIASAGNDTDNAADIPAPAPKRFSPRALAAVDWDQLHRQLQEYRVKTERWNLVFPLKNLPVILRDRCKVTRDADSPLEPTSHRNIGRIRDAAFAVMRKYADKFYAARRGEWELRRVRYEKLTPKDPNFHFHREEPGYVLRIPQKEAELAAEIRELVADERKLKAMWDSESDYWRNPPPRIHFCRHLYQPLLLAKALEDKGIHASPPGLNKGEAAFVRALRKRLKENPPDGELFLLRNQSRAGVKFHSEFGGVYPDFILWVKREKEQRIVFIEPHGMAHADAADEDPKARLYETLRPVIRKLAKERPDVRMDAFVISQTPREKLVKKYGREWTPEKFDDCHILFAEDSGNIARILGEKQSEEDD